MVLPIAIENGVNCAALGEGIVGAAKGHASAVMITVGTGIGGGIIKDGKIVNGSTYTAGGVSAHGRWDRTGKSWPQQLPCWHYTAKRQASRAILA